MKYSDKLEQMAQYYTSLGLNIVVCKNEITQNNYWSNNLTKCPYHKYNHLYKEKQSIKDLDKYHWEDACSIGIVNGYNNLVTIDIDECIDFDFVTLILKELGLPHDYKWLVKSGSHLGYHIIIYKKYDKENLPGLVMGLLGSYDTLNEFEYTASKIEIIDKWCTICPPSYHNSGKQYEFIYTNYPKSLPSTVGYSKIIGMLNRVCGSVIQKRPTSIIFDVVNQGLKHSFDYSVVDYPIRDNVDILKKTKPFYMVLDIETDGLLDDTHIPSIIQIAWNLYGYKGELQKRKSYLVKVNENNAFDINNIDPDVTKILGFELKEVLKELCTDFSYVEFVVAHNSRFESEILEELFNSYTMHNIINKLVFICTMKGSTNYLNRKGYTNDDKYLKLGEAYSYLFNKDIDVTHNAIHDITYTHHIFRKILESDEYIEESNSFKYSGWNSSRLLNKCHEKDIYE